MDRKHYIEKRSSLTASQVKALSRSVYEKVIALEEFKRAQSLFSYISFGNEVLTELIIQNALTQGKQVFAPRVTSAVDMEAVRYAPPFAQNSFGIFEPTGKKSDKTEFDIILVPGIAFDRSGARLGFGRGYYDRFLAKVRGFKIGLCYEFQIEESLEQKPTDIKMDMLIAP